MRVSYCDSAAHTDYVVQCAFNAPTVKSAEKCVKYSWDTARQEGHPSVSDIHHLHTHQRTLVSLRLHNAEWHSPEYREGKLGEPRHPREKSAQHESAPQVCVNTPVPSGQRHRDSIVNVSAACDTELLTGSAPSGLVQLVWPQHTHGGRDVTAWESQRQCGILRASIMQRLWQLQESNSLWLSLHHPSVSLFLTSPSLIPPSISAHLVSFSCAAAWRRSVN